MIAIPEKLAAQVREGAEGAREVFGDWLIEQNDWRAPLVAMERRYEVDSAYDLRTYEADQSQFWSQNIHRLRFAEGVKAAPAHAPSDYDVFEHDAIYVDPTLSLEHGPSLTTSTVIDRWGWPESTVAFVSNEPASSDDYAAMCEAFTSELFALVTDFRITYILGAADAGDSLRLLAPELVARPVWAERTTKFDIGSLYEMVRVQGLSDVYRALPKLESVSLGGKIQGPIGPLDTGSLPRLRDLWLLALPPERVAALAGAKLPRLSRLELWFHEFDSDPAALDPIFAGDVVPALETLVLLSHEPSRTDAVLSRLLPSPVFDQLRALNLLTSSVGRDGADRLVAHADQLHQLDEFDVTFVRGLDSRHKQALPGR